MALTIPNPSMLKVSFDTRSDFLNASIPADIDYVVAAGLVYVRDGSGTAATTADGATWSPTIDRITPFHFGAAGDGTTDDYSALDAMFDWGASVAEGRTTYSTDMVDWEGPLIYDGANGIFATSQQVYVDGGNRYSTVKDFFFKAISGTWTTDGSSNGWSTGHTGFATSGQSKPQKTDFILFFRVGATYANITNCIFECNNLCGGVSVHYGCRVRDCTFKHVGGIGVWGRSGDVWVDNTRIYQWIQNDPEYYNESAYTGIGVYTDDSDMRVTDCTFYWLKELGRFDGTNCHVWGGHFFNGCINYRVQERGYKWAATTAYSDEDTMYIRDGTDYYLFECTSGGTSGSSVPVFGTDFSTVGDTVSDGSVIWEYKGEATRQKMIDNYYGVDTAASDFTERTYNAGFVTAGSRFSDNSFNDVYLDNCHNEHYAHRVVWRGTKVGHKVGSTFGSMKTYWWKFYANQTNDIPECRVFDTQIQVESGTKDAAIEFGVEGSNTWQNNYTFLEDSGANTSSSTAGDGLSFSQPYIHITPSGQGDDPGIKYLAPVSGMFLGFADNNTSTTGNKWTATTAYSTGETMYIRDGTDYYLFECTSGGTSGSSVPVFGTDFSTVGDTFTDGTVTWEYKGETTRQIDSPEWVKFGASGDNSQIRAEEHVFKNQDNSVEYMRIKNSALTFNALSAEPTCANYSIAMSDGTSSTNGFGTSGAGLYEKLSGSWTKL